SLQTTPGPAERARLQSLVLSRASEHHGLTCGLRRHGLQGPVQARCPAAIPVGFVAKTPAIRPYIEIFHNIPYANHHLGTGFPGLEPRPGRERWTKGSPP